MSWFSRCSWCGGPFNSGNCRHCTNVSFGDEFFHNPDPISNDETLNFSYPPSQTQTSSFDQFYCYGCGDPAEGDFRCQQEHLENSSNAITPDLPNKEPDNSLSMGDEHLRTIPETESDEVIKSSVENLVPIPSKSEGIPDDTCDVPFCDNSLHLDVLNDHFKLLSDFNDDCTLSDHDSFEDFDYVEASPPNSELVSLEEYPSPFTIPVEDSDYFYAKSDTSLSYSDNSCNTPILTNIAAKANLGMTSLADKAILLGADNHPPMLEKDMYDSWKSIMCLCMLNRQHGRMILESVKNSPLLWPTAEENGVTIPKKYTELSTTEAIQADCDVKATNIILQGLPPEVYALVSTHKVVKELWERIQMLMQGTSLTKQERELNTKFLNTLPPEWSKFVTDVKLVRDMHTTNVDQLHAYLGQHEYHANEVCIMHERTSDPLVLVANHQMNKSPYQPHQQSYHQHQFQPQVLTFQSSQYGTQYHSSQYASQAQSSTPLSITYPLNDFQSSVNHNVYNPSSLIP
nr:hypothetical protein [Tanacetum cinerariifolium]